MGVPTPPGRLSLETVTNLVCVFRNDKGKVRVRRRCHRRLTQTNLRPKLSRRFEIKKGDKRPVASFSVCVCREMGKERDKPKGFGGGLDEKLIYATQ